MKASNILGYPVYNRYEIKDQTVYTQYENDPDGLVVTISWENG